MGTVMGKTQACAVAWFFGERRVPQIAARAEQVSEWITMWRGINVDTRRSIREVSKKKAPILANDPQRWNQATSPISVPICSVLEAGRKPSTTGFWQAPDDSATLDGALFNKAQISNMEMQTWKRAAGHSLSAGMEKGLITDFDQKARFELIQGEKCHCCACTGLSCWWSHPRTSLRMILFPINLSVCVASRGPWPPGNTNCGNVPTHEGIRSPCDICAGILGLGASFVCPRFFLPRDWSPANEFAEYIEARMCESSAFNECADNNLLAASDGSGGSRDTRQNLRQVAFGVATFSMQILSGTSFVLCVGFLGDQVPSKQKVPRAELWGAIHVLSRVDEKTNFQIPIDAKFVTKGTTHREELEQRPNGDLLSILFQLSDRRSGNTDVTK